VAYEGHAVADNDHLTPATVFTPADARTPGHCFVFVHGGGMVACTVLDLGQTPSAEDPRVQDEDDGQDAGDHPEPRGQHIRDLGAYPPTIVRTGENPRPAG
jgi:hypothetical protein